MAYILVADDNTDITDVLSAYIKKEGHDPVIAGDGIEAMERFREYNPACVLLDVMMPREDGYEVLRKIRA
ncbi:MAG: response regulator, partial [Lachnospiraceae bacterium]|nr:response regulator [Lachnospiraceae bacterium]